MVTCSLALCSPAPFPHSNGPMATDTPIPLQPRPPSPHHNGPLEDLSELLVSSGQGSPDEAELLPSLADLSPPDTHYQRATVTANQLGQFGITLRHFSIQPDNLPVSVTENYISAVCAAVTQHTAGRAVTVVCGSQQQ